MQELDTIIPKLLEQNILGKISDETYYKMSDDYELEQHKVIQRYHELKSEIASEEKKSKGANEFIKTIKKYENATELNRSMLVELIDSIYVYQAETIDGVKQQKVEINYRFLAGSQYGIA